MSDLRIELSVGVESFISNMNRAEETMKKNTEGMGRRATSFINSLQRQFDSMTKNKYELDAVRASTMRLSDIEKERIASLSSAVEAERRKQAALKAQRGAIDGLIISLEKEAATIGKTKNEINDYILSQNNATEADIARTKQLQAQIDAVKTQGEWQEQEKKRNDSIKSLVSSIEQERDAIGKTNSELKLMQLESMGATESQLKQAKAALEVIDANNKQSSSYDPLIGKLKTFAAITIGSVGLKGVVGMMDTYSQLASRVRNATTSTEEFNLVQERLSANAKITYRDLSESTNAYLAFSTSMGALGYSTQETLDLTDSLSFALTANAATAQQAESATNALSMSMAKGKVDANAWASIYNAADNVVGQIARHMKITEAEVIKLGASGKLALKDLVGGLIEFKDESKDLTTNMAVSFADSMQNLKNTTMEALGKINETYEITGKLATVVGFAADNIGLLSIATAGFVAISFGKHLLGSSSSAAVFSAVMNVLTKEIHLSTIATNVHSAATAKLTTFTNAATVATGRLSAATVTLQAALPYVAALTAGLTGLYAVYKFAKGEDSSNWISDLANTLTGGDNDTNSLGTRLFDFVENIKKAKLEYLELKDLLKVPMGPIGWAKALADSGERAEAKKQEEQKQIAEAVKLELTLDSVGLIADINKTSESFALAADKAGKTSEEFELLTAKAKLKEIAEDSAIKAGDEAALAKYKEAEAAIAAAEANYQKRLSIEAEVEATKKRKAEEEANRSFISSSIEQLGEKLKTTGKSADEVLRFQMSTKGASAAQLKYVSTLQASIAAQERDLQIRERLKSLADRLATTGMSEREKELYELKKDGASAEQLSIADKQLQAIEQLEKASNTFDKSATTMADAIGSKKEADETKKVAQVQLITGRRDDTNMIDQKITRPLIDIGNKLSEMPSTKWQKKQSDKGDVTSQGKITLEILGSDGKKIVGDFISSNEGVKQFENLIGNCLNSIARGISS